MSTLMLAEPKPLPQFETCLYSLFRRQQALLLREFQIREEVFDIHALVVGFFSDQLLNAASFDNVAANLPNKGRVFGTTRSEFGVSHIQRVKAARHRTTGILALISDCALSPIEWENRSLRSNAMCIVPVRLVKQREFSNRSDQ